MGARALALGLWLSSLLVGCAPRPAPSLAPPTGVEGMPAPISDDEALAALKAFDARLARGGALLDAEGLARARRDAMRRLLLANPRLALERAMVPAARAALPPELAQHVEQRLDGRGTLHVLCALPAEDDPAPASGLERLVTFEGSPAVYRAGVFGRRLAQGTQERVPLHGVALDGVIALEELPLRRLSQGEARPDLPEELGADCLSSTGGTPGDTAYHGGDALLVFCTLEGGETASLQLAAEEDLTAASSWTEGAKSLLFIRVDYSDDPGDPIATAAAQTLVDTTLNGYYQANSYGKTSLAGTVTPTFRLPRTKADYQATADYLGLRANALAAATDAGYVLNNYQLDMVGFKSTFSGWAGRGYVGGKGTWLNGSFSLGVTGHELGHNFGLNHANRWNAANGSVIGAGTSTEYGNPFDMMGNSGNANTHFGAWSKRRFDWLSSAETQVVTASGTYRIHALEQPISSGLHALKIPRDGTRDYWVEFRPAFTTNRWVSNGAVIIWGFQVNTQSQLLDMWPATTTTFTDAALVIGRTFSDPVWGIHLTPTGKGGTTPESLDVVVNLGDAPGNRAPTASIAASATSVGTGVAVNLTATASDPDGDPLAYFWDFDDGNFSTDNRPNQTKSWSAARHYQVLLTVSDMKGKTATAAVLITVGAPTSFRLQGTVTAGGQPLPGARISDGTRSTYTLADGRYVLAGVPAGNVTLNATAFDYAFTRGFAAPLAVSADAAGLDFTATANPGYAVSGRVTSAGVGLAGVLVSDGARTATTDAAGDFTLATVPNGRYPLTATLAGWQFTPSFTNPVEVYGGPVTQRNFYASGVTLSGSVSGVGAAPVVSDGVRSVTAVQSGSNYVYSLPSVPNGSWNLTATLAGSTITPSNFTNPVTVAGVSRNNLNFQGTASTTFRVSGAVTTGGTPLPGVVVDDGTRAGTTDSLGRYTLVGVPPGTYTLTPTRAGYTFVPATRSATVAAADLPGQDFATTVTNLAPTVANAAAVSQSPTTAPSVTLTALGADDGGEAALTYTWVCSGGVQPPSFSANGTNAAKTSVATFTRAGTYSCEVTITDTGGLSVRSQVAVQVTQELTQVVVAPATASVPTSGTQAFTANQRDQFNQAMYLSAPAWSASGGGTVSTGGLFSAAATPGGPYTVTATVGTKSGSAFVTVTGSGAPTIATAAAATPSPVPGTTTQLSVLAADDAGEASLLYTWSAPTAPGAVTFSANGSNAAKSATATFTAAGDYLFLVTVTDTAGNVVTSTVAVTVTATPTRIELQPQVAAVQPGQAQAYTASVVDQFDDALSTQPTVAFSVSGGGAIDAAGSFVAGAAPGGPFTVTAASGGLTATALVTVAATVDTTPPVVSLARPLANARLSGPVQLEAAATDDVGVVRVEFFSDGTSLGVLGAAPWQLTFDVSTLGDGTHALTARATDAAGNAATSDTVPIVVDTSIPPDASPPAVSVASPVAGAQSGVNVGVAVDATDDVGVTEVAVELDGAVVLTWTQAPWAGQLTAAPGAHTLVAVARDAAGNVGRSAPVDFQVLEEAPPPAEGLAPVLGGTCGCSGASGAGQGLAALALLAALRRRRRVR